MTHISHPLIPITLWITYGRFFTPALPASWVTIKAHSYSFFLHRNSWGSEAAPLKHTGSPPPSRAPLSPTHSGHWSQLGLLVLPCLVLGSWNSLPESIRGFTCATRVSVCWSHSLCSSNSYPDSTMEASSTVFSKYDFYSNATPHSKTDLPWPTAWA